ncbi:hypothetical protein chiPu_0031356, partial [Chiloscyllium punctatum]|nr:hypothetical protein [Chiloscyllium punctatum]
LFDLGTRHEEESGGVPETETERDETRRESV